LGLNVLSDTGNKVAKAAVFLIISLGIARILGFARESVMVTLFGQNYLTDAYRAAFSIPDFIYMMLVGGALSAAFIPVFSSYISTGREDLAWESASVVFNYIFLFLLILIAVAYIFTAPLMHLLAPGLPAKYAAVAVSLTHIMFIQTFFMVPTYSLGAMIEALTKGSMTLSIRCGSGQWDGFCTNTSLPSVSTMR